MQGCSAMFLCQLLSLEAGGQGVIETCELLEFAPDVPSHQVLQFALDIKNTKPKRHPSNIRGCEGEMKQSCKTYGCFSIL